MKKSKRIIQKNIKFRLSFLSACISAISSSLVLAGPGGGQVSGGNGSISNSGNTTTIHQQTDRMAIDWQTYNVDVSERVQYIQPDSSSVSLNRILSNSASQIQGRIDANGRVVLVNPHGIIFGEDSVVNAGGILASGLSIDTDQFMNGDFTFSEIEGTDGAIVASGIINAASGGSVALLGKSVKNEGLISAELGSVHFAAGREAVVTFGEHSFIGVRVSEALVTEQMGVDAAVLNNGEINAAGGQVLLTGSASRDVFSGIINTGDMEYDRSVIVNEDGSYTFGGGVDIVNAGSINVSGEEGGEVILLGENITHSGNISADSITSDQGGSVELHSADTTLIVGDGEISVSAAEGVGGDIKVLGDHVGLIDSVELTANGIHNGGQVLIGGDKRGGNSLVPNASAVFAGSGVKIGASATENGDGGKIILWGDDYLYAHGQFNAQGLAQGDGGFIETSSAVVNLAPTVSISGGNGGTENGQWLIDPYNITIGSGTPEVITPTSDSDFAAIFTPVEDNSFITAATVLSALATNTNVLIETTGDGSGSQPGNITFGTALNLNGIGNASLTIRADNDIDIDQNITDSSSDTTDSLNLILSANHNGNAQPDGGNINIASGVSITIGGGNFTASGVNFDNQGTINVRSSGGGGDIDLDMSGNVTELGQIAFGDSNSAGTVAKRIAVTANNITTTQDISYGTNSSSADHVTNVIFNAVENITFDGGGIDNANGANIANITLNADTNTSDGLDGNVSILNNTSLWLTGGDFIATGHDFTINGGGADLTNVGTEGGLFSVGTESNPLTGSFNTNFTDSEVTTYINQGGSINRTGNVSIYANGNIDLGRTTAVDAGGTTRTWDYTGSDAVSIILDADGNVTLHEALALDRFTGTNAGNILSVRAGNTLNVSSVLIHANDNSEFTLIGGSGGFINTAAINSNGRNIVIGDTASTASINVAANIDAARLDLLANGNIDDTVSAVITTVNNLFLDSGATGNITLDNSGFTLGNRIFINSGNDATIVHEGDIIVRESTVGGNLSLTATGDGDILDLNTEAINVTGTTTLTADGNDIILDRPDNNFGGAVFVNSASLTLVDEDALVLGNILTTDGAANNTITASGAITQTSGTISTGGGSLSVTGTDVQVNAISTQNGEINITANDGTPLITLAGDIDSGNANITLTGDVELATTVEIDTVAGDNAGQLTVTGNITADDDANAESFTVDAGIVALNDVSTAATQAGASGGSVNISGSQVTIGAINTSGRDALNPLADNGGNGGTVDLSVDTDSASTFILNGDINTQGGLGALAGTNGAADIALENGASSGLVDLSNAGILTSSVTITGSNSGSDVLVGPDDAINIVSWQSNASGGSFGNSLVSSGVASFTGFETVTGGSGADVFTIGHESVVTWNGGEGDDEFNITAGIDTDLHSNISGVDDASTNTVNLTTTTGEHDWTITGVGDGNLAGGFSFFLFDTLNGSDGGDDRFQLNSSFGGGNTINARGQNLGDSLLVSTTGTQTIGFGDVQGGIGGIEAIEAVGDADDFIVQLADGSTNNRWDIENTNRGTITNVDTGDDISFINFATAVGNSGDDNFTIGATGSIARIDGGTGTNAVDFSAQTGDVSVTVDESLGDIDTSTSRLVNIQTITAPVATTNTLNLNSASSSEYTWRFFDFDADAIDGVDGVGDGQLFEDDNLTPTLSFIDFDIFNGGDGTDNFVIEQRANNITVNGGGGTSDGIESTIAALFNRWDIDETNGGDLIVTDGVGNTTIGFSAIETIVGANDIADTFSFTDTGNITGTVTAGEADGVIDTVDLSVLTGGSDVIVSNSVYGVENVERVIGNAGTDNSLTGSSAFFRFDITGNLGGEVFNDDRSESLVFENFGELIGTAVDDIFTVSSSGFIELIRAGAGSNNQLISSGVASNWFIDDLANDVSARRITSQADGSNRVASFNAIQTLQGADEFADTFTLIADSNFNGTISGGTPAVLGSVRDELIVESTSATNVDWDLLGSGYSVTRNDTQILEFSGIENIIGGAGNDTFAIDDSFVDSTISIDGSQTIDRDVLDVSRLADNADALLLNVVSTNNAIILDRNSTRVTQVNNVEAVRGASQSNLVFQSLFQNTWNIQGVDGSDGVNDGQLTAVIGASNRTIDFENIAELYGDDIADTFIIADGAEFNGVLRAEGGTNVLTNNNSGLSWQLTDAFAGSVAGTTFFDMQTLNANDGILVGRAQNNVWNVTSANSGTVSIDDDAMADEIAFTGMSSLSGNSGDDTFNINVADSVVSVEGDTGVNTVDFSAQTADINVFVDEILNEITVGTTRLTNIQVVVAPATTTNTLDLTTASASEYTWRFFDFDADAIDGVDGVGDGQLFEGSSTTPTLSFIDFGVFNGGDGTDNFVIEQRANNITVNGRDGASDSLESLIPALSNRWDIDETNGGDLVVTDALGNTTIGFSTIENLTGADDVADTFVFTDTGSISGTVNAGETDGIVDTVDYSFASGDRNVVVDSTVNGVQNVERVVGNASTDNSLTGSSDFFRFDITGNLSGEVFNDDRSESLVFENFGELIGSDVDDIFTVSAAGVVERIDASSGSNNQLISLDIASNWFIDDLANDVTDRRITSQADGSNRVGSFNAIQTLQGADDFADTFTLIADSNFNGTVIGGTSATVDTIRDELNVESTSATNVDWDLLSAGYSVTRNGTQTLDFSGIETIVGGVGNDTFAIDDSFVDSTVTIDGNQTTDRDVLDVSRLADNADALLLNVVSADSAVTLDRNSTRVTQINNVEAVRGASQSNLVFQSLFQNTWNIQGIDGSDGVNDGQLTAVIGASNRTIDFENIAELHGDDIADTFIIADGAEFNGVLRAEGGTNVLTNNNSGLTWQLTDAFSGSVAGTTFFDMQTLNANDSILVGRAQNNVWNVTSANGGTVSIDDDVMANEVTFTGMSSLYGNSGDDDFVIATTGSITGDILGTLVGTADTTSDRLEIESTSGVDVSWTINNTSSADRVNSFSSIENLAGGDGDDIFSVVNVPFALTIDGGDNLAVVDASLEGDRILWNVSDIGANVYLSDSEQRIRRNDGSTAGIEFTYMEVIAGSNSTANTDSFQILGGTVEQARGRNGADTFTIDNSEKDDMNIRLFGGGAPGVFNNVLIGGDRNNTWRFVGTDTTDDTLNYIDDDNKGIIFNDAFQTFIGGILNDDFIVIEGNEIPSIDGLVGNIDSENTLEIQSASSDAGQISWNLTGDNQGNVTNRVGSFSNIHNLIGGEGRDVFTIAGGNVRGLIDGRDNTSPDAVEDTLNVGSLTEVVVVVGEDGDAIPLVAGAEDSPYINVTGIENILADDVTPEENENDRWIVVNSDRSISWSFNNFNSGTVVELAGPLDAPTSEGSPLVNSQFFFDNFGSAQGGVGADTIDNPDGLTGIFNPSGGGQNLIYGANVDLAVAFITPDILSVTGTDGNVILRIAPEDLIEDVNFNGDNAWTIDAENAGSFLADYFDNGEDDTGFGFNFSGVNRIEGGSGNDLFTFTDTGVLTDGYINGGGGNNRIALSSTHSLGLDFGVSTLNSEATDLNNDALNIVVFPAVNPVPLPELFELDNRSGVIDVLNISSIDAVTSVLRTDALRLRSAESGNFTWRFDDQLLNTDNNVALSYSGFDEIQGGGANDRFELPGDVVLANQLDGGDGQDTVDLSAFAEVTVDLDNVTGDYLNMEAYEGNNANSEFLAADGLNIWTIDGVNQGSVTSSGETIRFSGFNTIQGGESRDEITIEEGGIDGDIFGNGGDDELNVALGFTDADPAVGGSSIDIDFFGGEGTNEFIVTGGSSANRFVADYTPGSLVSPTQQRFEYAFAQDGNAQNTSITVNQVGDIVEQVFTSVMTLNDVSAQVDTIRVSNIGFEVEGFSTIASSNNASLNIEGETTDAVLVEGNITLANEFAVTNASVMAQDESFVIDAGSAVRFSGNAGLGDVDRSLNLESANLFLNTIQGDTFLSSSGDLNIAQLNSPNGTVDILSTGSITDSAVLSSLNDIRLRSDENIILDNQNTLTGVLQLSAQNITLNNSVTRLGDTNAENLTITARGGVQDEGTINITDTTTINGQESSTIILDTSDNQFNVIEINNAASLELVDTSRSGVTVSGDVADSFAINADSNIVANALNANAISLVSESGGIVTQDTLNATSQVRLTGNDIAVNSAIDVSGNTTSAVNITATDSVQLNSSVLANIDSSDVTISANTVTQNAGANLRGRNIILSTVDSQILNADLTASDTVSSNSGAGITMTGGVFDNAIDARVVDLSAQDSIVVQSVNADQFIATSVLGGITQQGNITTNTIDVDALNGVFTSDTNTTLTLDDGISTLDAQDANLNGDILGNGTLIINLANQFTQNGDLTVSSFELNAGDVLMGSNTQINSANDVLINAQQNIQLAQINSGTTVSLLSAGAISDNNGSATNVSANSLFARSESGFGQSSETGNLIETAVANIDVQNNTNGIGLSNDGDVSVTSIISNSDIYFQNNDGNVVLANADSGSYNRATSDAREAGGVINSNYDFGVTTINIPNGFLDATPAPFVERPELVGDIVDVTTSGGFGVSRRLVVYARTEAIIGGRGIQPFFGFNTPPEFGLTTDTDLLSLTNVSSAAELLVEVEDLQDVDPAVFTNIRNFAFDDVSIRMPRDQVYDDGAYEDDTYDDERESDYDY